MEIISSTATMHTWFLLLVIVLSLLCSTRGNIPEEEDPLECYTCDPRVSLVCKLKREVCTSAGTNFCYMLWSNETSDFGFYRIQRGCMTAAKYLFLTQSVVDYTKMAPKLPMKKCLITDTGQLLCVCRHKTKCNKRWMYHLLEMISAAEQNQKIIQSAAAADHQVCDVLHPERHSVTTDRPQLISPVTDDQSKIVSKFPTVDETADDIIQTVLTTVNCSHTSPDPIRLLNPVPKPQTTTTTTTTTTAETTVATETPKFRPAPGIYALRNQQAGTNGDEEITTTDDDQPEATEPATTPTDELVAQLESLDEPTTIATNKDEFGEALEQLPTEEPVETATVELVDEGDENIPETLELEVVRQELPPESEVADGTPEQPVITTTTDAAQRKVFPVKNAATVVLSWISGVPIIITCVLLRNY